MIEFLRFFFSQPGHPWYEAAVWSNVVAVVPCGVLAWLWSRTAFWPLRPIREALSDLRAQHRLTHELMEEVHHFVHTGEVHPRARERLERDRRS